MISDSNGEVKSSKQFLLISDLYRCKDYILEIILLLYECCSNVAILHQLFP